MDSILPKTQVIKTGPYTPGELAALYRVSTKTLRTWLEPHLTKLGKRKSKYYTSRQVKIIFECVGEP
jgi:DNA-binding transcriptional MerR regulator